MTEVEWQSADDPAPLLAFAEAQSSDRKLRLFALACCRATGELVAEGVRREALDVAERHTDGEASDAELGSVVTALNRLKGRRACLEAALYEAVRHRRPHRYVGAESVARNIAVAVAYAAVPDPPLVSAAVLYDVRIAIRETVSPEGERVWVSETDTPDAEHEPDHEVPPPEAIRAGRDAAFAAHRRLQAAIARDILRGPAAPAATAFAPWLSPTVVGVAEAIYRNRSYADLPILADALEEAGCDHAAVLGHCRGPGQHWRGCWVLDALTGRG